MNYEQAKEEMTDVKFEEMLKSDMEYQKLKKEYEEQRAIFYQRLENIESLELKNKLNKYRKNSTDIGLKVEESIFMLYGLHRHDDLPDDLFEKWVAMALDVVIEEKGLVK